MHKQNSFITLTFNDEHLPKNKMLSKRTFQLFMKRLRRSTQYDYSEIKTKKLKRTQAKTIRYYHCGEYGDKFKRPHYHALLFGHDFSEDRKIWKNKKQNKLWRSRSLEACWQDSQGKSLGYSSIGKMTFESAAYVARYCTKKIYGSGASDHYPEYLNPTTGELITYQPEYATMSRRPGIGQSWFQKYQKDVYPADEVISRNRKMKPPKYYDRLLEKQNPKLLEEIKEKRELDSQSIERLKSRQPKRLKAHEKITSQKINQLQRSYEHGAQSILNLRSKS
jgi:hypothetical protein